MQQVTENFKNMGPTDPANHPATNLPTGDNYMDMNHMVNPEKDAFKGMRNHTHTQSDPGKHKSLMKPQARGHMIRRRAGRKV